MMAVIKWGTRTIAVMAVAVAAALLILPFDGPFVASERLWQMPWTNVKAHSESLCRAISGGDLDFYAYCMSAEKTSHQRLQASFGVPAESAVAVKNSCAEFEYFTPQLRCVESRFAQQSN